MQMEKIRLFINNDYIYFGLVVLIIIIVINIFSRFLNNVVLLAKNFRLIIAYLKYYIFKLMKFLFKLIFFPFTIYGWIKEYKRYNQININNSRYKEI